MGYHYTSSQVSPPSNPHQDSRGNTYPDNANPTSVFISSPERNRFVMRNAPKVATAPPPASMAAARMLHACCWKVKRQQQQQLQLHCQEQQRLLWWRLVVGL